MRISDWSSDVCSSDLVTARDGLRVEGTLWRPHTATGKRGGTRAPVVIYPHGGPTGQAFRSFQPFKQVLVAAGFAVFAVDFRGSTGDRKSVVWGKSVSVRVDLGGGLIMKKKKLH